jgi:hypothetical protein
MPAQVPATYSCEPPREYWSLQSLRGVNPSHAAFALTIAAGSGATGRALSLCRSN